VWKLVITVSEEHGLKVFEAGSNGVRLGWVWVGHGLSENRVLRRLFGHKRRDVTGGWRKLHDEELCSSYSPLYRIFIRQRMRL
jgi:hypothetical protein